MKQCPKRPGPSWSGRFLDPTLSDCYRDDCLDLVPPGPGNRSGTPPGPVPPPYRGTGRGAESARKIKSWDQVEAPGGHPGRSRAREEPVRRPESVAAVSPGDATPASAPQALSVALRGRR